jgi:hypothetical protein
MGMHCQLTQRIHWQKRPQALLTQSLNQQSSEGQLLMQLKSLLKLSQHQQTSAILKQSW